MAARHLRVGPGRHTPGKHARRKHTAAHAVPSAGRGRLAAAATCAVLLGGLALGAQVARDGGSFGLATPPAAPAAATEPTAGDRNGVATTHPGRPTATPKPSLTPAAVPKPTPTRAAIAVPAACAGYAGNQRIACTLLPSFGFPYSQMAPLVKLWTGESNWRSTAQNPSSGAYGIPQALPAGKMASAGNDWRTNPRTQIRWGLAYIKQSYGTPARAWSLWLSRSPHWY